MRRHRLTFLDTTPKISVCPWQYYRCEKPFAEKCPVRASPDRDETLPEYRARVGRADGCQYATTQLTETQWRRQSLGEYL